MAFHRVLGCRLLTVAFLQHMILQAAGQCDDTILLAILCQILLASLLVLLAGFLALLVDFLLLGSKILLHNALGITVRNFQLITSNNVLDSLSKIVNIQCGTTHVGQLLTNADSQSVTYFIHYFTLYIY